MKVYTNVMKISSLILMMLLQHNCVAQQENCNRKAWTIKIKNKLPSSVCVSEDKIIYDLFSNFDYNIDHLNDLALRVGNNKISNGDTTMLEIYAQKSDSNFIPIKSLKNIYPIYFESYSLDYKIEDSNLQKLKDRYQGSNPLEELRINENEIFLKITADITTSFCFVYKYNMEKQDWLLKSLHLYERESENLTKYDTYHIGSSIDEFDYFDYLEGDF